MAVKDTDAETDTQTIQVKFQATGSGLTTEVTVNTHHGPGYAENKIRITLSSAKTSLQFTTMEGPECNIAPLGNARKRKACQISQAEEPTFSSTQNFQPECYIQKNEKCHGFLHKSKSQGSPHPLADQQRASSSTVKTLCKNKKSWTEQHAKKPSNVQKGKQGKQTRPRVTKMKASSAKTINEDASEVRNKDNPAPVEEQVTPVQQHPTETCTHFHCTYEYSSNAWGLTWFLKLFSR
ncbi:uncharacterized protein LOC108712690 [Xenopus laevis]|uniref:Uncharacterized protein LOC108712690 n=2 Tax=Xenopus laevis TaxID=8355 RepID=A0A1L8GRM7_XENLA|nr:uncharacterized protein LOC108712690 [Xenopus laevis]XP_018110520.1 uncharacterized protein LOC108712690 [Xenopus laevis]OCT86490.1 hypothetical protein XELAEV_18020175mg [Xenopus laevis]